MRIKIAKEIAETLYPLGTKRRDKVNAAIDRRIAERVITAKLEPVRDILEKIKSCEAPFKRDKFEFANSVIDTHVALADEALAMMGEEE